MRGEHNSKKGKRSFTILDTAEPKLILCKDKKKTVKHGVRHEHNVSMPLNNNINCIRRIPVRYPTYAYVSR